MLLKNNRKLLDFFLVYSVTKKTWKFFSAFLNLFSRTGVGEPVHLSRQYTIKPVPLNNINRFQSKQLRRKSTPAVALQRQGGLMAALHWKEIFLQHK